MKKNMSFADRELRLLLAAAIGLLYYFNVIGGTLGIVLLVLAAIFTVTGFTGFCPLYLPFGLSTKRKKSSTIDFPMLIHHGAQVIDVRTREEYKSGHLDGSINIPLTEIKKHLGTIDKLRPVVVCCASGVRSHSAMKLLRSHGFDVVNGGNWAALAQYTW